MINSRKRSRNVFEAACFKGISVLNDEPFYIQNKIYHLDFYRVYPCEVLTESSSCPRVRHDVLLHTNRT